MYIINELTPLEEELSKASKKGMKIGLVPTMGALHDGHMELIKQARRYTEYVIVSIFINPLQFNQTDDFLNYPSNPLKDSNKLKNAGNCLNYVEKVLKTQFIFNYIQKFKIGNFKSCDLGQIMRL